ncbi:hypothetical protein PRN20_04485 [Devosia sp. ZB163]|uniref:hypothetical protein n=1 Tax=Devosia sp. ZB163 TaxID=3025938 RepID=UPI002360BC1C|nr:hypothetical protein [Devosia sp. ZB163]MDC9822979.1 hypothetical protein [Devosia sp. ZB163]
MKLLNVSERSVKVVKAIVRKGEPEIAKAVEAGAMTLQQSVFSGIVPGPRAAVARSRTRFPSV